MRRSRTLIIARRAAALSALALLSLLSACATTVQPSRPMSLGPRAPAPMGYLEFCARRPEQCGLSQVANVGGSPADIERRAQDLRRRYYWAVALADTATPSPRVTPASGVVNASIASQTLSMWRGAPPSVIDAAPRLDPAQWGGQSSPLLQPAVLVEPIPATPKDLFQTPPPPADPAADPNDLDNADAEQARPVQPIVMSPEVMSQLNSVNRGVNGAIRYAPARALYGNDDYWTLPLEAGGRGAGDCKDYVLEKRKALVERGLPSADLSIAVVTLRTGVAHAVLLVTTDQGELVLDSLSSWVMPWNRLDYHWVSRQAPGRQLVWVKVEPGARG